MRSTFLPFAPPFLRDEEVEAVTEVLRSGWLSRGPRTQEFERAFAEHVGSPAALGLNSCTAGLHLSLVVLGIGPGDEVICPTMTFAATVNVVEHVGATPVLVDVCPDTLCIDPEAVEAAITPRTRAVMVVHYGGHPADMGALQDIGRRHGVQIVEDAAHAFPAKVGGEMVGASGRPTSFSFYATKNLTTGEGGMLTGDAETIERARALSLHGIVGDAWDRHSDNGRWSYRVAAPGFKYNMTDVQAALGLVQLGRLDEMQRRRREVARFYREHLGDEPAVLLPVEKEGVESSWHLFPIRLTDVARERCPPPPDAHRTPDLGPMGAVRDRFIDELRRRNIGTSVHYIPVHLHPYYRERYALEPGMFPVAQDAFQRLVSLPIHPGLTDEDLHDVVEAVRGALRP